MADGIRPAKNPMPNGFDLATFAPSLDGEAGESFGCVHHTAMSAIAAIREEPK